jgi:uncharacterized protein (TIGR03066 family)
MRLTLVTLAAFATALIADAAPVPKPKEKTEAEKIVGTWKMVKRGGEEANLEVEFTKDGKLILRRPQPGGPAVTDETGKYKVADGKMEYTLSRPGGAERTGTDTIKKLTDDELVLVDAQDVEEEFTRVKEEKKKEEKK